MPKYSKIIYQILRTIDYCYSEKIKIRFDLEKLGISEHQLGLYLHNLTQANFIGGIIVSRSIGISYFQKYKAHEDAYITLSGMMFLEENSEMKKFYASITEIRDWFCAIVPIGLQLINP